MESKLGWWKATFLGLFVVGMLAAAATGLVLLGAQEGWAGESIALESSLSTVHGLRVGTRVRVLGIPVGQVTGIVPPTRPGEPVVVRFFVDSKQQSLIRANATTRVVRSASPNATRT